MSVLDWTRARTRSAPTSVLLSVHNSPPRLRKANLLPVRTKEEIISRVRHQLSLAHRARARGNSSSCGIQTLDEGGSCQEAPARGPLRIPDGLQLEALNRASIRAARWVGAGVDPIHLYHPHPAAIEGSLPRHVPTSGDRDARFGVRID